MSSLEIIECNDEQLRNERPQSSNVDIIELTSGVEDATPARSLIPSMYPSSPRLCQVSSPIKKRTNSVDILDQSAELSAVFRDDTRLQSSPVLSGKHHEATPIPINDSSVDSVFLTHVTQKSSSPEKMASKRFKSSLDFLVSDEVSSSDIAVLPDANPALRTISSITAMGAKWSQIGRYTGSPPACQQESKENKRSAKRPEENSGAEAENERDIKRARRLFVESSLTEADNSTRYEQPLRDDGEVGSVAPKYLGLDSDLQKSTPNKSRRLSLPIGSQDDNLVRNKLWDMRTRRLKTSNNETKTSSIEVTKLKTIGLEERRSGLAVSPPERLTTKASDTGSGNERLITKGSDNVSGTVDSLKNFIVFGKCFTPEESKKEISRSLSTAVGKKRFNAVNKLAKDSAALREEIVLDMDESLYEAFKDEKIDLRERLHPTQILHTHTRKQLVKVRRNCQSIYDYTHGVFYPVKETLVNETISIFYYDALQFFHEYATKRSQLLHEIRSFREKNQCVLIVLGGRDSLARALQNNENKRFRQQITQDLSGSNNVRSQSKGKHSQILEELNISAHDIEKEIDKIVVSTGTHFFIAESKEDFVTWISSLILVIARKRYDPLIRHQKWSHINLRSAQDSQDALSKTLEQLQNMTKLKAQRVVGVYQNFQRLYEDVSKGYLTSGSDGNTLMGKGAETAMATLLTSENPDELIYVS